MISIAISMIMFIFAFGGSLLGMFLRPILPEHHQSEESRNIVVLGIGVIATMTAIVLGLLVEGAQSSFREQRSEIAQMSANVILLDRVLARYGPETKEARGLLRHSVVRILDQFWPKNSSQPVPLDPAKTETEVLYDKIQSLEPYNDAQRSLQAEALSLALNIEQTPLLILLQQFRRIPVPFLVVVSVLVLWVTTIFLSFGLSSPCNTTVIAILFLSALSVSAAIFLIVEFNRPFEGLIRMPSDPLLEALSYLGR